MTKDMLKAHIAEKKYKKNISRVATPLTGNKSRQPALSVGRASSWAGGMGVREVL